MITLWELYYDALPPSCEKPWKVYGNKSHKLLCADYQMLPNTPENNWFDSLEVVSFHMVNSCVKIYVREN
jgi:hypothetical protein